MPPPDASTNITPIGLALIGANRPKSSKVDVLNPCWNGLSRIRLKDAEFYVREGRAVWADAEQTKLRLVEHHPKNQSAKARADYESRAWEREPGSWDRFDSNWKRLTVRGLAAIDHPRLKCRGPE